MKPFLDNEWRARVLAGLNSHHLTKKERLLDSAEFLLELTNVDFARADNNIQRLETIRMSWAESQEASSIEGQLERDMQAKNRQSLILEAPSKRSAFAIPLTLLHRSFIKSYRDVVVYGIRILMYTGKHLLQRVPTSADMI